MASVALGVRRMAEIAERFSAETLGDALAQLLADPGLRRRLGAAAAARAAARYSWDKIAAETEAVYDLRAAFLAPRMRGAPWSGELPSLAGQNALYFREALAWAAWTSAWEQLARGEPPAPIAVGPSLIRRPPSRPAALAG